MCIIYLVRYVVKLKTTLQGNICLDNCVKIYYNSVTREDVFRMKDTSMNFLDRLRILMGNNGDNNSSLAKKSGIPYTTIDGLFKRGWEKAQISTIQRICDYYRVSLDYMVYGADKLSTDAIMVAAKYEKASEYGKAIIDCVLNQEGEYTIAKKSM